MSEWSVIYEKAIRDDGTLFFPERLSKDFLNSARRTMGSYLFANQYQNEIIPDDEKRFKIEWLKYYGAIPQPKYTFAFIDPAIGQKDHHDYTGICIIDVDYHGNWYLKVAKRDRLTPTQIVEKMFEIQRLYQPQCIGIEIVAYQEALLYIADQEMRLRNVILPIKGITRKQISKETRILGLVPRFEWGRIFINGGMADFEDEYAKFPRATHDDILDSLASLEEIVYYPVKQGEKLEKPNSPNHPDYEKWFIRDRVERSKYETDGDDIAQGF